MKSQFLAGVLAAAGLLGVAGAAFGTTVNIDRIVQDQPGGVIYGGDTIAGVTNETGDGGEFTLVPSDTSLLAAYSPLAKVTDPSGPLAGDVGFESFCLETGLSYPIPPGIPTNALNYIVSPSILNAPVYQPGLTISMGTAWLYSQFALGTLKGYDYAGAAATFGSAWYSARADDAAYLQAAIWYLQNQGVSYAQAGGASNPYLNLLTTPTGSGGLGLANLSAALVSDPGAYGVQVMNIGDPGTYQYQAQLVLDPAAVSTPDGGTTVLLMGVAVGGLALFRRKFAL